MAKDQPGVTIMIALLQQLPALVGVIVGAVTTYLLTSAAERTRWRRDHRVRWDGARMQAYVEYGNAVKRVVQAACSMAVTRGLSTPQSRSHSTKD
jgi:hypothetical protein